MVLIQKRYGTRRGIQIHCVNQDHRVGPLADDQAQVILWNILGVDYKRTWDIADPAGHEASGCIVTPARIANAHDHGVAVNSRGKLFL
jgi:hypothetical protein